MLNATMALPTPLAPCTIPIQETWLIAVQEHPPAADTAAVRVAAVAGAVCCSGATLGVQPDGVALSCVTA